MNIKMMKRKYNAIDLFKLIMAICVIAIHTHPFEKCDNSIIISIYDTVANLAVPFFFITSGFLLSNKFDGEFNCEKNANVVKKYCQHIFKLYILWTLIYLPLTIYHFIDLEYSFKKAIFVFVRNFIFIGEQYNSWPLWYLLSTIYALVLIFFLIKKNFKQNEILIIGIAFFVLSRVIKVFVLFDGDLPTIMLLLRRLLNRSIGSGRVLSGMFYISVGIYLQRVKFKKEYGYFLLGVGLVISVLSNIENMQFAYKEVIELILVILTSIGLFEVVKGIELRDSAYYYYIRKISTIVYFIHMYIWTGYYMLIYNEKTYGMDSFLVTTCISIFASIVYLKIKMCKD